MKLLASALIVVTAKQTKYASNKTACKHRKRCSISDVFRKMDLNEITRIFPDVEYHPDQFPGAVFRLKTPKTATLLFSTGKMVCTGSKSEEMARKEVKTVVQKLRKE